MRATNGSYSGPSSVASFLHSLPHYTSTLQPFDVGPKAVLDNPTSWMQSFQVIGGFLVLLMGIYLLIDLILRCYARFFRARARMSLKHYRRRRWAALMFAFAALATACVALATNGDLHDDVHTVIAVAMRDGLDYARDVTAAAAHLVLMTEHARTTVALLLRHKELPLELQEQVKMVGAHVSEAVAQASAWRAQTPDPESLDHVLDHVERSSRIRFWVTIGLFVGVLLSIALLFFCGYRARQKTRCYCPLQTLTVVMLIIIWVIASASVALSVGLGDVCMEPTAYTTEIAKHHTSVDNQRLVEYYLTCGNGMESPLAPRLHETNGSLVETGASVRALIRSIHEHNATQVLALAHRLQANATLAHEQVLSAFKLLGCARVHNDYFEAVNSACGDFISRFFGLAIWEGVAAMMLIMFRGCMPARKPLRAAANTNDTSAPGTHVADDEDEDEDEPYEPPEDDTYESLAPEGYEEERPNSQAFVQSGSIAIRTGSPRTGSYTQAALSIPRGMSLHGSAGAVGGGVAGGVGGAGSGEGRHTPSGSLQGGGGANGLVTFGMPPAAGPSTRDFSPRNFSPRSSASFVYLRDVTAD